MMVKKIFIFIGAPGSGKGSLAHKCTADFDCVQLSTGNLFRKHISEETELGRQIDLTLKSGRLVDDDIVTKMVEQWFETVARTSSQVILDGFPRTQYQAEIFDKFLKESFGSLLPQIVKLNISDEEVIRRLSGRLICNNKECQAVYSAVKGSSLAPKRYMTCDKCSSALISRKDDDPEAIKKRLGLYHRHDTELLDFYKRLGYPIINLSVERPLADTFDEFKRVVG